MASQTQISMAARRARILDAARKIVAEGGVDALTTRGLAAASGVSAPTLYNLIGDKQTILAELAAHGVETVWAQLDRQIYPGPLQMAEAIVEESYRYFAEEPDYYRAIVLADDRLTVGFAATKDGRNPSLVAGERSVAMAEQACEWAQREGLLRQHFSAAELGLQMFTAFRAPLRDWARGVIELEEMRLRQLRGFYLIMAADASEAFRCEIFARLPHLNSSAQQTCPA